MCGSPPDAPQLPAFPNLTPDEQKILGQWGSSLNQQGNILSTAGNQLSQNQNILQQISGLFNSDGTLNQSKLAELSSTQQQAQQGQAQAGQSALSYLNNIYGNNGLAQTATTAYQNALNGNVPANQQMEFTQNQNFQALKEQAAQQGIQINGDSWKNATSSSTAGQKLLQNYQQNANIQNNNYQLGYLQQAGANLQGIAGAGQTTAGTAQSLYGNALSQPLGYLQSSITNGMSALTPYLTQYQQGLSSLYQPYYMQQQNTYNAQVAQQMAQYQGNLNSYSAGQNQMMGWANLGMQGLGLGANAYAANQNKQGMMALAAL